MNVKAIGVCILVNKIYKWLWFISGIHSASLVAQVALEVSFNLFFTLVIVAASEMIRTVVV